ncbi:MAG TPA: permease [Mycobacteriales bacterium]|nr:permease [Mycobacteriales bacterium]
MAALDTIGRSLDEGFFMLWETLWALILGFTLSGIVQAFVSRRQMHRLMGDHRPAALARGTLFGMASSSCSYAASALAKSLFARGADFTTAIVFMVASTNLVIELGAVLWLLIGWQFAAAEFVGGTIMIALLGVLLPRVVPAALATQVRARDSVTGHDHGEPFDDGAGGGFRARLRQPSRWAASAGYTIADLRMVRREIVIGFVLAGFLAVAVPMHVWSDVFLTGHGPLTTIENAVVGPFVAIISFVCSIGNVALASALWKDGISFGGVIAFLFADLITIPLLLMYRTMYGGRITLRLLAVLWPVMSASGLITELLFRAVGGVPNRRPTVVATEHVAWNYTTFLNIVAVIAFAALLWLYRHRDRFDDADAHAIDPVCRMQVEKANAPATISLGDETVYFCSQRCRDRFAKDPARSAQ